MKRIISLTIKSVAILVIVSQLQAVVPGKWELRSKEEFLRGKFSGISLSSDGVLSLGPKVEKIELPAEEFYLSFVAVSGSGFYLGTGHSGKIYKIGAEKKVELYYQTTEMDVTSLAVDQKGNLYAGTSPNGKIYKITAKGKGEEFFNPQEKYIWDLMFTEKGNLLAAVGESGGLYEISPAGEGKLIFKAKDNHILCLRKSPFGELLAGSGGRGLVYKISPAGRVSVLFESAYEEIKNIAFDHEGNIYVSASGLPSKAVSTVAPAAPAAPAAPVKTDTEIMVVVSPTQVTTSEIPSAPSSSTTGKIPGQISSAIFQVAADGLSKKLWSSTEEIVYSLIFDDESKKIVFGTGHQGRIYTVDKESAVELLCQESSEQVYGLYQVDNQVYLIDNNPCLFGILQIGQNFSGEYLSPVLDAKTLSIWGRIDWQAELPQGALVQVQSRSGNTAEPDETWSEWSPPYIRADEKILSPKGRYLQLKVNLKSQSARQVPKVGKLLVFYLQTNLTPVIDKLEVLPPNQVFIKPPEQEEIILGIDAASQESAKKKDDTAIYLTPKKSERQGFRTITWEASDENDDKLNFRVFIRKEEDQNWRLMQDKLTDKVFSFDTRNFPDGTYFLKIEASDLPANPPGTEKKVGKISPPFIIDNSLPVIKNFSAVRAKDGLEVSFEAEDAYSYIEEVKFLVKPEDWQMIFPVDGICDSKSESFKISIKLSGATDNLLIIRVKDSFGNIGVFQSRF
jgi:hypothetical protein